MILIAAYLLAIVVANLLVAQFGPAISIVNAFALIGLDITARDALHERWHGGRYWKMALLIGSGSVISAMLNWEARQVALASFVAVALSGTTDTLVYRLLGQRTWSVKVNGSNIVSSAIDSIAFPAIAFGFPLLLPVMVGQFVAKVLGGALWSLVLKH